jgi:hypothetical protein
MRADDEAERHALGVSICTSKASRLSPCICVREDDSAEGDGVCTRPALPLPFVHRQYSYFCTSKPSKLSTCMRADDSPERFVLCTRPGTQFACRPCTKVQILTQNCARAAAVPVPLVHRRIPVCVQLSSTPRAQSAMLRFCGRRMKICKYIQIYEYAYACRSVCMYVCIYVCMYVSLMCL